MAAMPRTGLGELTYAALAYDLGRSFGRDDEEGTVPTSTIRVLAVLQGQWVADGGPGCRASLGKHDDGCCWHRDGETPYSLRWLARMAFGQDGLSQRRQVVVALGLLSTSIRYRRHGTRRTVRPVLTLTGAPSAPRGTASWQPDLIEDLLAGHFQLIPMSLVRGLKGRDAFRVWLHVLMKPGTAKLGRGRRNIDFAISGPSAFAVDDLGFGKLRPGRLRETLERHAAAGNAVQDAFRMEVLDRTCGRGLKLRLTRLRPPARSVTARKARRRRPVDAAA
jgi:hypothetical protein